MATVTNQAKSVHSDTQDEATYTWDEAGSRIWDNQTDLSNQSKTSGTVANQAKN